MAKESSQHKGHRQRMRARVEQYGLESLEPHEALEYVLYITNTCLLYTSPSPRDISGSRMPSSA